MNSAYRSEDALAELEQRRYREHLQLQKVDRWGEAGEPKLLADLM